MSPVTKRGNPSGFLPCTACRAIKKGCDIRVGHGPCTNCLKRGIGDTCVLATRKKRTPKRRTPVQPSVEQITAPAVATSSVVTTQARHAQAKGPRLSFLPPTDIPSYATPTISLPGDGTSTPDIVSASPPPYSLYDFTTATDLLSLYGGRQSATLRSHLISSDGYLRTNTPASGSSYSANDVPTEAQPEASVPTGEMWFDPNLGYVQQPCYQF
ncbi:hypothetical protein C8Q78DRAFT_398760 [Trametes maxima]|nr:hypothetical protein C8Q78DRAFT_398760 [Trametes maxima]